MFRLPPDHGISLKKSLYVLIYAEWGTYYYDNKKEAICMSDGFKDKVDGAVDKVKGEAKDAFGKLTDDKSKQAEGKVDKTKGKLKDKAGDLKNKSDE